jgi:hypothetical protein
LGSEESKLYIFAMNTMSTLRTGKTMGGIKYDS